MFCKKPEQARENASHFYLYKLSGNVKKDGILLDSLSRSNARVYNNDEGVILDETYYEAMVATPFSYIVDSSDFLRDGRYSTWIKLALLLGTLVAAANLRCCYEEGLREAKFEDKVNLCDVKKKVEKGLVCGSWTDSRGNPRRNDFSVRNTLVGVEACLGRQHNTV